MGTMGDGLAAKIRDASGNGALLTTMREAFSRRDFDGALAAFEQLAATNKLPRNMRIEATCLATRALVARKDRLAARALLKSLRSDDYSKPIHYDFLAHAYLDLRNYKEAARVCERAAALIEAQKKN
jgi:hypothetical protein